jgi:hypothetical protein
VTGNKKEKLTVCGFSNVETAMLFSSATCADVVLYGIAAVADPDSASGR